ncbi:MAG: YdiU family protein [Betaproteobacteria bacterium]|nr:YdiU family protein [Betaproteobacteria bacterium]
MLETSFDTNKPSAHLVGKPLTWSCGLHSLGEPFFTPTLPTPMGDAHWVSQNRAFGQELGLDDAFWDDPMSLLALSGNAVWPGSQPVASVYSGHQFGVWAGQLGDGRAVSLGELDTPIGRQDWQLKGAGPTPYSRRGDGRAVLRSSIREYLCSEAMHGLGIPTTRALALCASKLPVWRETVETAAVLTRVAPCFIRFGHFEHFASVGDSDSLQRLVHGVIAQFFPDIALQQLPLEQATVVWLKTVSQRTAELMAQWQTVGFCHGVMNTDNMSALGLTLDYGPFQFLDAYDPEHICNHSDHQGRYAYQRQPQVAFWNLFCLGQAVATLVGETEPVLQALNVYKTAYPHALQARWRQKLGLSAAHGADAELIDSVLHLLSDGAVDFTIFWRRLSQSVAASAEMGSVETAWTPVRDLFLDQRAWLDWERRYIHRLGTQDLGTTGAAMLHVNPKYVLRNHLGETAIQQAQLGDFSQVDNLLALLRHPFDEHPESAHLAGFPPDWASSIAISCSS